MYVKILELGNMTNLCIASHAPFLRFFSAHPGRRNPCSGASSVQRKSNYGQHVVSLPPDSSGDVSARPGCGQ